MSTLRSLILIVLACGSIALAQTTAPAPTTAPALDAIRAAKDPSSAVEAYARGVAADPAHIVDLEQAYVHHMVALGAPEIADAQAHDLVDRKAADPLTRGVAAYNDAARGNAPAALANLKTALTEKPDDLFLLRTAGQIVAWYDGQTDRSNLSKDDVAAIEWLRTSGTGREEFANAYRAATEARRPPYQSTQPTTAADAAAAAVTSPPTTYYYPAEQPYYTSGYYSPYYSYWPSYSIIILRDRDCDRHRHHDWFDRGRFDRGGIERGGFRGGVRTLDRGDNVVVTPLSPTPSTPRNFVGPLPVNPTGGGRNTGTVRASPPRQMGPQPDANAASASPAPSRSASPAPRNSGGGDRGASRSGSNTGSSGGNSGSGSSDSGGGRRR